MSDELKPYYDLTTPDNSHFLVLDEGWHERYHAETDVKQQMLSLLWASDEWAWVLRQPGNERDDNVSVDGLRRPWSAYLELRNLACQLRLASLPDVQPVPAAHGLPAVAFAELTAWLAEVLAKLEDQPAEVAAQEATGEDAAVPLSLPYRAGLLLAELDRTPTLTVRELVTKPNLGSERTIKRNLRDLVTTFKFLENGRRDGQRWLTEEGRKVARAIRSNWPV